MPAMIACLRSVTLDIERPVVDIHPVDVAMSEAVMVPETSVPFTSTLLEALVPKRGTTTGPFTPIGAQ